jgi:CheY-like chemotaxis protein
MTQPLALVFYERLLPGTQLVNRLQDLHYRVQTVAEAGDLADAAEQHLPMLALVDLQAVRGDVLAAIARTRSAPATRHLPIIAFTGDSSPAALAVGQEAGASLITQDQALLNHLPELLEQALRVE